MATNIIKFEPKPAPKAQDPWRDMIDEYNRSVRIAIACGFSIIAGLALGAAMALGKMK